MRSLSLADRPVEWPFGCSRQCMYVFICVCFCFFFHIYRFPQTIHFVFLLSFLLWHQQATLKSHPFACAANSVAHIDVATHTCCERTPEPHLRGTNSHVQQVKSFTDLPVSNARTLASLTYGARTQEQKAQRSHVSVV